MRPVRLSMRAFGPYTDEQALDFRLLGDRSFFLIHGPTGAGKSTLLDAICFALYGETSGGERQAHSMRSDHAPPEAVTEVSFDFSLAGSFYRVTRSPDQERARKRGGGTTRQRPSATLWKRSPHLDDSEEGEVLASQWSRVTEEVERLLGFRSEQFRQVVMLPQGQFQRFLLAGSRDREQILEVLFQTEFYRLIEEALKESAKAIRAEFEQLGTNRQLILKQAAAESPEELGLAREEHAERLSVLREHIRTLKTSEKDAESRFHAGLETLKKIQERDQACQALEALKAREPEVKSESLRLDRARKAFSIRDVVAHAEVRRKELEEALRGVEAARKKLGAATRESQGASQNLEEEKGRETLRDATRRHLDELTQMRDRLAEMDETRRALETAAHRLERIGAICESKSTALEQIRSKLRSELRPSHERARRAEGALEGRRLAFQQARRLYRLAVRYRMRRQALAGAVEARDAAARKLAEAQDRLGRARRDLEATETRWIEGQAAILARGLVEGVSCPVCGSAQHPAPAHGEGDLPSEAALKKSRKLVKDLEREAESARSDFDRLDRAHMKREADVRSILSELEEEDVPEPASIKMNLRDAHRHLKESSAAARTASELAVAIARAERSEAEAQRRLDRLARGRSAADQRRARLEGVLDGLLKRVPEELREAGALERAVAQTSNESQRLAQALEKAQQDHQTALSREAASREALFRAEEQVQACKERFMVADAERNGRLDEAGFADLDAHRSSVLGEQAMSDLDARIRGYYEELKAADERWQRAEEAAKDLPPPDIEELRKRLETVKEDLTRSVSQEGAATERIKQVDGWLRELGENARRMENLERRFAVVGRISDAASGRNAQRITFQRFVLATLLDGVLETASRRLRIMSKGRFDLQRARERVDQRSASGLDLSVYDAYTGTTRPVNTLSGGESFLASLALALGLADVVQAYAGGVRLETIFVDEGFGSLDPEALDLAFQTLLDLREGNRLVGIISHVPELKERIDVRLEITPGRHGSTARFSL